MYAPFPLISPPQKYLCQTYSIFIDMMADEASEPSSTLDDSNSDADQLLESHNDEDAGPMPGVENPAVAHAPEPEAVVPAGIGNGGGNGLEPLGVGRAASRVLGRGAGRGQRGGQAPEGGHAGRGNKGGHRDGG